MTESSGQLTIPCGSVSGTEFTNTQSSEVTFKFAPSGSFSAASFLPECTAAGIKDFKYQSVMTYPQNTSFALLAVSKETGAVLAEAGQETTLVLKPGETVIFIINDVPGCYDDNTGSITVNWSGTPVEPLVGGNAPVKKTLPDSWGNFYILDRNNPVNKNGQVKTWEIWAENTRRVQLVIYRPTGSSWQVVGKSDVKTPKAGFNEFSLSAPIQVQKGDCVGIFSPDGGVVSFTLNSGSYSLGNLSGKVLFTNQGGTETAFISSSNRTYAVQVKGD